MLILRCKYYNNRTEIKFTRSGSDRNAELRTGTAERDALREHLDTVVEHGKQLEYSLQSKSTELEEARASRTFVKAENRRLRADIRDLTQHMNKQAIHLEQYMEDIQRRIVHIKNKQEKLRMKRLNA